MLRLALVNMPFGDWYRPSFALSQLSALVRRECGADIDVEIMYLNHDVAAHLGLDTYNAISGEVEHLTSGVGDWFFRGIAFPDLADNTREYTARYYQGRQWKEFRDCLIERREGIEALCEELIARYDLTSYDVVGFTSMFAQTVASIGLARLIKNRNPAVVTVMGGANCEPPMGREIVVGAEPIDFVFSGPALHSFPEFLKRLVNGDEDALHAVPGVVSRRNADDPRYAKSVGRDRDVNDFIEPDYDRFIASLKGNAELSAALDAGTRPVLYFETSRGCWWGQRSHCTFCGLNGTSMEYRAMDPTLARRQLAWIFQFAPWCTTYACTDNIMPRHYPREVFTGLRPPPDASIFYEVKLPVPARDLRIMSQAGVNRIQPGIEALATGTLALMGKGTTAFQNIQFLKNCVRYRISPAWNLLIGFPGEPSEVYRKYEEDLPLLYHLPPPAGVYMVRFDRYSPYFAKADQYRLKLRPMDYYAMIYPFGDRAIADMAYFFTDDNMSPYMVDAITWRDPLNDLVGEWNELWQPGGRMSNLRLELAATDNGAVILDSRYGSLEEYLIDPTTTAILRRLNSPARPDRLADELNVPMPEILTRLGHLRERALLFEEDDKVLSLVLTAEDDAGSDEPVPVVAHRTLPVLDLGR
jgi:ribosomal peptide maturation radical SAM protein 1